MNSEQLQEIIKEVARPLIVAAIMLILTIVFVLPKWGEIFNLQGKIKSQNQEITQLQQKLADLVTLSEAELFENSTLVLEALPTEGDLFKNMAMIRKIFEEQGVSLESFKLAGSFATASAQISNQVSDGSGLSSLKLNVSFAASFENFREMIKAMKKILPLLAIEGLKFGSFEATGSATLARLEGKMDVVSYFSPLPKVLGKIEQPLPKVSNQDQELLQQLRSFYRYQAEVTPFPSLPAVPVGKDNPFPY